MKHLMINLETLGVNPGCAILSIGAVFFDPHMGELGEEFYGVCHAALGEQERFGLEREHSTLEWWNEQSTEARKVLDDPMAKALPVVLAAFSRFSEPEWRDVLVYGNGADFDLPILKECYRATQYPVPWGSYNGRCYRTLKNLAPHIKIERGAGTHHNALDDAKAQALHLMRIVEHTTLTLG